MAHDTARAAPAGPSRRSFLGLAVGLLGAAVTVLFGAPAVGFVIHPLRKDPVRHGTGMIPLGRADRFLPGVPVRVNVSASLRDAWLRNDGVRLGAVWVVLAAGAAAPKVFSATCPHLGCAVDFDGARALFACPCHTSVFALDGAHVSGPAPRAMDELPAVVKDGELLVEFHRYRTGRPDRVEA
jgi:Rieske Fe-S protein